MGREKASYAYCAGDPVNFIDPDGRKIEFRKDVPEWVKQRYYALQHKKYGDKKYKEKKKREDPQYKNQLEREVIKDFEWEIARKHGDIREDEVTREGHYGSLRFFSTKGYGYAAAEYFREEITELIEIIK